ncbi:7-cyano-7-deazaguanine synthase QueC [Salinactinospora qingdaonensis]|uniref:7-cyano-7-deazaguanine synthase n=1 Tax=Salinactinospora qingdaonensis TaxID=702744 RepID=A0ABP7FKT2_9ACTN
MLLSGGLDSTTALALAKEQGFTPYALSFDYGQRNAVELTAARRVARELAVENHITSTIDLRVFGGSALTDDIEVPKGASLDEGGGNEFSVDYVPARNTIFLSFALAYAEVTGATDIFTGVNAGDYSGSPDHRPEYLDAYEAMANLGTKTGVSGGRRIRLHSPLIHMSDADIIRTGMRLDIDYALTISCYDPDPEGRACGACGACRPRLKGFADVGVADPAPYVAETP